MDCKNFEGSEERRAIFHGDHNQIAYIQQAANAAITGAIGSSGFGSPPISKKRKNQEISFGTNPRELSFQRVPNYHPAYNMKSSAYVSSTPVGHAGNNGTSGSSKLQFKSLLSDIIQPQDLKELCSVLTVYSVEAAKAISEQKSTIKKQEDQNTDTDKSSAEDQLNTQKEPEADKSEPDDCLSETGAEKISPSDDADMSKSRPMSPGTLALMCDEQDMAFIAATPPKGLSYGGNSSSELPRGHGLNEAYAEQERVVLSKFRDCLTRLITFGDIKKEKKYSMSQSEPSGTKILASTVVPSNKTEMRNHQQGHVSNGITKPSIRPVPIMPKMFGPFTSSSTNKLTKVWPPPQIGDTKPNSENATVRK